MIWIIIFLIVYLGRYALDAVNQKGGKLGKSSGTRGVADEIKELKQLLVEGVISQEDFDKQKKKLLS